MQRFHCSTNLVGEGGGGEQEGRPKHGRLLSNITTRTASHAEITHSAEDHNGWRELFTLESAGQDLTRFNKIATQGAPQMAVDKEANSLSRVYSYYSKFNLRLFYV